MNRKKPYVLLLAAFFGFFSPPVNAQVNLKAGYNISLVSDPGMNEVISLFSASQPYTSSFDKLGWIHGFEAGLRFKSDIHAFELSYQTGYQHLKAKGDLAGDAGEYTDKIKLAVHSGGIGYQVTGEVVGLGADLQYQLYNTRAELTQATSGFKNIQKMLAMKFYLMFTLTGSGGVDAAIAPYYVLPFETYDLDPLSLYLNQQPGPAGTKWTRFGLSILFYNGEK